MQEGGKGYGPQHLNANGVTLVYRAVIHYKAIITRVFSQCRLSGVLLASVTNRDRPLTLARMSLTSGGATYICVTTDVVHGAHLRNAS